MANKIVDKLQMRKEKLIREVTKSTELIERHKQNLLDYQEELQKIESQLVTELLIEYQLSVEDLVELLGVSENSTINKQDEDSQGEEYDI